MLYKKNLLQLNNSKRFYKIKGEQAIWIYDSYSHEIFRSSKNIFSRDKVAPITPSTKCTVMINTSNRCNLNCSYCYRCKNNPSINNLQTITKTLNFVMTKYKPKADEYVISYSMTSESSLDLPILKQIADEYINIENYQFVDSDIIDSNFKDFYAKLQNDFENLISITFPDENKNEVIKFLNSLLGIRNLFDILNLSENMFSENDRNEINKRQILAKWRVYRLNRWYLEALYDKYIHKRKVPFVSFWFMTNGTCASRGFIDFVKSCDINPLWISLDGPKDVHDLNRKYNNNNGTYDDVIKNIKVFRDNGINMKASSVITSSFPKPLEIINHLLDLGFNEISLTPVRTGFECSFNKTNVNELLKGYDEIFDILKKSALNNDFKYFHLLKDDMCLAAFFAVLRKIKLTKRCAFDDQLVIDSQGNIYPCLYFTGNKNFCYGNIEKGINNKKIKHNIEIMKRGKCKRCWARYLCSGTCFYNSYVTTGNYLKADTIECKIKKHLAEQSLKLIVFLFEHKISIENIL